jgi:hypothetical protein
VRHFIFSIFDSAASVYMRPFPAQAEGAASREFSDLCVAGDSPFAKHPEDYTLMRIGMFDDNTGEVVPETPVKVVSGLECVAAARKVQPGQLDAFDENIGEQYAVGNGA